MKHGQKNFGFYLIAIVLYIIFFAALFLSLSPRIINNFKEGNYIETYNEYKRIRKDGEYSSQKVAFYSLDGIRIVEENVLVGFRDNDHLIIEALLKGPSEENLKEGLISYIDEDTRLLGLSIENDVCYINLSEDFLSSSNLDLAKKQIEETLKANYGDIRTAIIVNGEII